MWRSIVARRTLHRAVASPPRRTSPSAGYAAAAVATAPPSSGAGEAGSQVRLRELALLLLSPQNNAVGPPPEVELDRSHPLTDYWTASSHNSYIVGDQITGLSTADAYRRQLLQGSRRRVV